MRNLIDRVREVLVGAGPIPRRLMRTLSARRLLARSRTMARAVPVGDGVVLCRVLTRYRLYVDARDTGFGVHLILDGCWESGLTAFMAGRIKDGWRVVDVGANHGYYSVLFAHLVGPTGRVAAVEPHPRLVGLLRRSLYANGFDPWVKVHALAAGDVDGARMVLTTPGDEFKNSHVHAPSGPEDQGIASARLVTILSDWMRVDLIKIDVEGAEEACLDGAWPLILRDRPAVVLEFNAARCRRPRELLDRLVEVYGGLSIIDQRGRLSPGDPAVLASPRTPGDVMLFMDARAR